MHVLIAHKQLFCLIQTISLIRTMKEYLYLVGELSKNPLDIHGEL